MGYKVIVVSDEVITAVELRQLVGTGQILVLDARDQESYDEGHIPGAVNLHPSQLERTVVLDCGEQVSNQLRSPEDITPDLRGAGLCNDVPVCVYDEGGGSLAARLWWALDVAGHQRPRLLDGGLDTWVREVDALATEAAVPAIGTFIPSRTSGRLIDFPDVITAIGSPGVVLCNTLPREHYLEETIPGSISFPYTEVFANDNYPLLRSRHELLSAFAERGVTPRHRIIFFCEIGYSASLLYCAARYAGFPHVSLYDGSMVDWSARGGELVPGPP